MGSRTDLRTRPGVKERGRQGGRETGLSRGVGRDRGHEAKAGEFQRGRRGQAGPPGLVIKVTGYLGWIQGSRLPGGTTPSPPRSS